MFSLKFLPYSNDIYHILRVDTPTAMYFSHPKHLFNSGLNEHRPHDIYYLIFNKQTPKDKSKQNKANMLFYWMKIRFQIQEKTFKKNFRYGLWPKITCARYYLYRERQERERKRCGKKRKTLFNLHLICKHTISHMQIYEMK